MRRLSLRTAGILAILAGSALQLYFFERGFYSISWDESGRTLDAWAWARHGVIQESAWLPFYRVVVGSALKVFPDLVVTPRIISNAFGLAAIPAVGWLAWELFQDRRTTMLSLSAAALFSQRAALSLAPVSSIMFSVFVVSGMALFCRWLRTESMGALYASVALIAVAGTERFEVWLFAAAVAVAVWTRRPRLSARRLIVVTLILFAFPGTVVVRRAVTGDNPINAIRSDSRQHSTEQVLRKNPAVEFVVTNSYSGNLIGLAILIPLLCRGGRGRCFAIVAFAPLSVLALGLLLAFAAQTGPSWRLIGVWSLLLLPLTAHAIASLTRWEGWGTRAVTGAAALLLVLFLRDLFRIEAESHWAFPPADRDAGQYIREVIEADPTTKISVESGQFFYLNVMVASQHPDSFLLSPKPDLAPKSDLLLYRTPAITRELDSRSTLVKIGRFGEWSLYRR